MKQYENYKHSGLEWLGNIPMDWMYSKLKWISNIYAGGTPSTTNEAFWGNGNIPWLNSGTVNQKRITIASEYITEDAVKNSSTKWVPKGSLVMALAGQGKTKGTVAIVEIDATCNQSMAAIVPDHNEIDSEYLFYWLDCNYQRIRGLAGDDLRDGLNLAIVGDIFCPLPSFEEQTKISYYLNHQITIIDQLISKKEKLIEMLKEKRQAIINEAVTKGLDSDAKVMDSGIKWLGEIPEHWMITPVKHTASLKGRQGWKGLKAEEYVSERNFGFLSTPDIKYDKIDFTSINYITKERYVESPEIMLEIGDVLLVKDGSTLGITNIVSELPMPTTVNSSIAVLRVFDVNKLIPEYLLKLLSSDYIQTIISQFKAGQGVPHLFQKDIKNFEILIPPISEQKAIVRKINESNEIIGQTIKNLDIQIAKLKEYRQTLISEAVTGKIDVRDWEPKN